MSLRRGLCTLAVLFVANTILALNAYPTESMSTNATEENISSHATAEKTTRDIRSCSSSSSSSSCGDISSYSSSSSGSSESPSSASSGEYSRHATVSAGSDEAREPSGEDVETVCYCDVVMASGSAQTEEVVSPSAETVHPVAVHGPTHLKTPHAEEDPSPRPMVAYNHNPRPIYQYPAPSRFLLPRARTTALTPLVVATAQPANQNRTFTLSRVENNLLAGEGVEITQHPYQAQLILDGEFWCGAAVISNMWALTAAHCLFKEPQVSRMVRAGSSLRNQGGSLHRVSAAISHWLFNNAASFDYDVALLKVLDPFHFSQTIQPISLPVDFSRALYDDSAVVSGWGELIGGRRMGSKSLQHSKVKVLPTAVCQEAYSVSSITITRQMICTEAAGGGSGFYQGDSGGPLASLDKLVGIASFGPLGWSEKRLPGVFTSVAEVREWIRGVSGL